MRLYPQRLWNCLSFTSLRRRWNAHRSVLGFLRILNEEISHDEEVR